MSNKILIALTITVSVGPKGDFGEGSGKDINVYGAIGYNRVKFSVSKGIIGKRFGVMSARIFM